VYFCFASLLNKQPVSLYALPYIVSLIINFVPVFTVFASFKYSCFQMGERARTTCFQPLAPAGLIARIPEFSFRLLLLLLLSRFSCVRLCDPIDGSPPGSAIPGILQARTLEWVAISFSNAWKWKVKVKSLSRVWLLATPWTAAYQAPLSMGFSRQEYWSGVPLPSHSGYLGSIPRQRTKLSIQDYSLLSFWDQNCAGLHFGLP